MLGPEKYVEPFQLHVGQTLGNRKVEKGRVLVRLWFDVHRKFNLRGKL